MTTWIKDNENPSLWAVMRQRPGRMAKEDTTMGTRIYTADGDWVHTPTPYETIRSWLLTERPLVEPYIEVPGAKGNAYLIKISNITCIEQELPKYEEEKQ